MLDIPQGITHGETLQIKGKGVPMARGRRGDPYLPIKINLPSKLSRSAKSLIEKLKEEGI